MTLSLSLSVLSSLADLPFHLNQNEEQNIKTRLDSLTSRCSEKEPTSISPNSFLGEERDRTPEYDGNRAIGYECTAHALAFDCGHEAYA